MESFSNENIIKSIFKSHTLRENKTYFDKIYSSTLLHTIQQIINYKHIFMSKRKHFTIHKIGSGSCNLHLLSGE
jgi:hypothetical protein